MSLKTNWPVALLGRLCLACRRCLIHPGIVAVEALNLPAEQALVHSNLGALQTEAGQWHDAAASLSRALELYEALELPAKQAVVHTNLGALYQAVNRWDAASASLMMALNIYKTLNLPAQEA